MNEKSVWLAKPLFILPAIVALLAFSLLPSLATMLISFTDWNLGQRGDISFIGLDNYHRLLADPKIGQSLRNTALFIGVVVSVSFALALAVALAICKVGRMGKLWQTVYFLPATASLVAIAVVWQWILHPELGIVAYFLSLLGVTTKINWLNDGNIVLYTLAFITIWQMTGYYTVLFLTGLLQIPTDLYEAARVDGASSGLARFRHITWPLLAPTSLFVLVITIIKTFQVFDLVRVLTRGGPANQSEVLLYTMFMEGFAFFRTGIAAAIATFYLVSMLVLILVLVKTINRRIHYGY